MRARDHWERENRRGVNTEDAERTEEEFGEGKERVFVCADFILNPSCRNKYSFWFCLIEDAVTTFELIESFD